MQAKGMKIISYGGEYFPIYSISLYTICDDGTVL